MAQNFVYKESKVITKKLVGFYDSEKHTIDIDGEEINKKYWVKIDDIK